MVAGSAPLLDMSSHRQEGAQATLAVSFSRNDTQRLFHRGSLCLGYAWRGHMCFLQGKALRCPELGCAAELDTGLCSRLQCISRLMGRAVWDIGWTLRATSLDHKRVDSTFLAWLSTRPTDRLFEVHTGVETSLRWLIFGSLGDGGQGRCRGLLHCGPCWLCAVTQESALQWSKSTPG